MIHGTEQGVKAKYSSKGLWLESPGQEIQSVLIIFKYGKSNTGMCA